MAIAKVGRRGSLVIPSKERKKAKITEGDRVEVAAEGPGEIRLKKLSSLAEVQRKMRGRLPAWNKLEGKADRLLFKEVEEITRRHHDARQQKMAKPRIPTSEA